MKRASGMSAATTRVGILLLEDDPLDARLIDARLEAAGGRFVLTRVADGASFRAALASPGVDVILSDYNVPGFDGLAALELARQLRPEVPFVFVSGALGEERAIDLLKRGATDYVLKDNLDRLLPCVEWAQAEARERVERAQTEAALRRSEARSRALIAALVEGVAVQDPDRRFLEINVGAETLLGLPRDRILGHCAPDLPIRAVREDGSPLPVPEHPVAVALRTGEAQVGQVIGLYRPDGSLVWLSLNSQPLLEPDGRTVTGVVSSFFDITERKLRAELEQQLIGIVSHDLRTPLSTILYAAEALLLREGTLDEGVTGIVRRMRSSAERATRLVRDLLDFTQVRLGSGIPVDPKPTDLHELTRATLDELTSTWGDREVRHEQHGDGAGHWDSDRLVQVVQNLVSNALAYSPAQTAVRVCSRGEPDDVVLEVHNEGPPIAPARLSQLFDAMKRGDDGSDRHHRSVGLGLFIVYHVVQAHGGSVEVRSTAADGTTFLVRLPRMSRSPA